MDILSQELIRDTIMNFCHETFEYLCITSRDDLELKFIISMPISFSTSRTNQDEYLKALTRDNVQLLINQVWSLPTERVDEAIVVKLPKPKFVIPRARAIPKPRPLTKWQQFAKDKGIRTKKKGRSKLQWDDELRVNFYQCLNHRGSTKNIFSIPHVFFILESIFKVIETAI